MSHVATVKTAIRNLPVLVVACKALGLTEIKAGQQTVQLYSEKVEGNFSVKLPGWKYPVVVNTTTGQILFDNFEGRWGEIDELNKLTQEYSLTCAEEQLEEFRLQGWDIQLQKQENGDIQIVATH